MIQPVTVAQLDRFQWLGQFVGFHGVQYVIGLLLVSLLYPVIKELVVPIAALVVPISHGTLTKSLMLYSIGYWLPLLWKAHCQLKSL